MTTKPDDRLALEVTVNDPPTETLPEVVILPVIFADPPILTLPNWDNPDTFKPPKVPTEETFKEDPTETLPPNLEKPVISSPAPEIMLATVKDCPTPTLPEALTPAKSDNPLIFKLRAFKLEDTDREDPTDTLPVVVKVLEFISVAVKVDRVV